MTGLRKLERDFAHADKAAVTGLLAQLGDEDALTRFGLESRLKELDREIARLSPLDYEPAASAALFFGGRPVVGARGVESEFASAAIGKFQDMVSKILAHETSGLRQRGIVPNKSASTLHITSIVRGSFGFLLEEIQPQKEMVNTALKAAVQEATRLLDAFGEPDEEQFRSAVETIDERLLITARDFFEIMREGGATLRLVAGDTDLSFGAEAVSRAVERATTTRVEEREENIPGQLGGVLPDAHQFEFRTRTERGTIRGKVDRALTSDRLAEFNRQLVNVDALARMRVKRVFHNDEIVRENFILLSLAPNITHHLTIT